MKFHRYAVLPMTSLLLLAACSDDSTNPTPTPISTATPSPTPTPTPAPSSYQSVADFTRDRAFSGLVSATTTQTIPATLAYHDPDSSTLTYSAATQTFTGFGQTITPGTNKATLVQTDATLVYQYLIATSPCTLTIYRKVGGATYVGYVTNFEGVKTLSFTDYALIGAPTLTSDLPSTGTTTYQITAGEIGTSASGQTLVIDAAARRLSGTVTLTGASTPINVMFQGMLDSQSGRIDGTVTTADGTYTGAVHGRVYGPAATEIGLIFDLKDNTGNDRPGILIGHK
ncbi:hypothetical protein [Sphingomonas sp. GC_Shp_3]|uniref:hypothetical protein n=1 Tax=Sphingomonas sp. GC_Shp_3 TaxID=2937383 RepID=UPI00226A1CB9|nr:hypothetical protein [Sphingomonas sp. GC_Shp_3]